MSGPTPLAGTRRRFQAVGRTEDPTSLLSASEVRKPHEKQAKTSHRGLFRTPAGKHWRGRCRAAVRDFSGLPTSTCRDNATLNTLN